MKQRVLGWAYRLGYRRCLIATRRLDASAAPVWPEGLEVRPFRPADAEPLRALGAEGLDEFPQRLARGDRPWGVWAGEALVAFGWSSTAETDFSGLWVIRPGPGEAYLYNFFTHPSWRGRGLYPLLLGAIGHGLAETGVNRAWIAVVSYNQASWRGVQKAGFRLAATYKAFATWGGLLEPAIDMPAPDLARAGRRRATHGAAVPARL